MSEALTLETQRLDQPLPPELAGSGHGWFSHYRRWPVYSPGWARGRVRAFAILGLFVLALMAVPLLALRWQDVPFGGLLQLAVQMFAPLLAGPWLGVWVRRQGWPPGHETAALAAVMLALVLALLAFHVVGAEYLKQWVAEATGQVDEQGKRKRMVMSVGVVVSTPDEPASAPPSGRPPELSPMARTMNGLSSALTTFWLGGGAGLWARRRERQGLASLARERELAHAQAQRREAELQLSVLAAQVEPHFLFNTLAGVRSAIATDPARASDMIDHLVDYLRASIPRLRSSVGSDATLGGQLEIVRAYLGLMAARMPRLQWDVRAAPELLALPCPPLMLISLAENAVKHGVEPKIGPVRIEVLAQRHGAGMLEITVADDGAGFADGAAAGSGLGLTNIRERLQQMYQGRAALVLKARAEGGVAATLTLPLE
jgi:Histidine kinase